MYSKNKSCCCYGYLGEVVPLGTQKICLGATIPKNVISINMGVFVVNAFLFYLKTK